MATFVVPPLRALRYPSKALIVASLAWAILVGLGADAWVDGDACISAAAGKPLTICPPK
jgi:hypothetical protein